jgi:hypothetical protein
VWWSGLVIPALWRLRQKDGDFKASLGYLARSCLKKSRTGSIAEVVEGLPGPKFNL